MKKKIIASQKITFRLTAYWQKDGPKIGKRLNEAELGDFPDIESAACFLKEENPSSTWSYLFYYKLTPSPDFKGCDVWPTTIFDRNGVLRGSYDDYKTDCFPGRESADCRFQPGDIVQFGSYKLYLGVVLNQPPNKAFVARVGGETGLIDEMDDSYYLLVGQKGKDHEHLHECCMFEPDAPVPKYLLTLQKQVRAEIWKHPDVKADFYQKNLFFKWLEDNTHQFSHEPYLVEEDNRSFTIRFKGITEYISCVFCEKGDIMVMVDYGNLNFDIIMEFDLYEEETPEGRYLCSMCRDWPNENKPPEVIEYENRADLWIKHSFEKLAAYTRKDFTDDAVLCLSRFGAESTAACIVTAGEKLEKLRTKDSLFKELPVVVKEK